MNESFFILWKIDKSARRGLSPDEEVTMIYYINGYGVPRDILRDENYERYLTDCLCRIHTDLFERRTITLFLGEFLPDRKLDDSPIIYLAGGATNEAYPDRTEAGEMLRWFLEHGHPAAMFCLLEGSVDLQGNLEQLRQEIDVEDRSIVFCEHARQDHVRFLVGRMFRRALVVPIKFDQGQSVFSRLRQLLRLPLKVAGYYVPAIRKHVQQPLRQRFIHRHSAP